VHSASLSTRILQGVGLSIALGVFRAAAYRSLSGAPVRVALACLAGLAVGGAVGGGCYYATDRLRVWGGWRQTVANVGTLLVYGLVSAAALWIILGPLAWQTP